MQSRCLVLFLLARGLCRNSFAYGSVYESFLFRFDSFSATWVPIYLPVLTRASDGFFTFSGIVQYAPAFCAPVMRPSPQRATARRLERCQRSAASIAVHRLHFLSDYIVFSIWNNVKGKQLFRGFSLVNFRFLSTGVAQTAAPVPYMCLYSGFIFAFSSFR